MRTKSTDILFLDRETKELSTAQSAILILSPSFYWFVKEKLDIPLSQAKKVAPSMFEGIVPEGEYSYFVQKHGDEYWFFAYSDEEILQKLSSLGIKPSQIKKVYPAQSVLYEIEEPIETPTKLLLNDNGTIVAMPKGMLGVQAKKLQDLTLSFPKHSLPLRAYSSLVISEEMIYRFAIVLFLFIIAYAVQIFLQKRDLASVATKKEELLARYHLPATSLQLRAIAGSLKRVQKEQLTLRDELEHILRTPLQGAEHFVSLDFSKHISFEIASISKTRAEAIKRYLLKKLKIEDITLSGDHLLVKCKR